MNLDSFPRWVGWLWAVGGAAAVLGSLVGVAVGWVFIGTVGDAVTDTVGVSRRALLSVEETTRVIDEVFDGVAGSLREVQSTLADTSLTLTAASVITRSLGDVVTEEVPASVDAVRASLPALIDTASVIDITMRGLSFFGVDYDPDIPLDQSIEQIDARLAEIPLLLRGQQGTLEAVASDLEEFSSSTLTIADDLATIRVRLADASVVLNGYASIASESTGLLDELESDVASGVRLLRGLLVVVGVGLAATQTVAIAAGLAILRSETILGPDR
ncbi:MAG: hypothetical protein WD532_09515 [Acidimicrobiia bacterium]